MNIAVIGLGNLGSAIANALAHNGHHVLGWEHDVSVVAEINDYHANIRYLPDVIFHANVQATNSLNEALAFAEIVFICLPTRYFSAVLDAMAKQLPLHVPIVNMAKGLNAVTRQTAMQMLASRLPEHDLAMLSGPSLANEFSKGKNTIVVAASVDDRLAANIRHLLQTKRFTVLLSRDVVGIELGAIFKNVYALGMGMAGGAKVSGLDFAGAYLVQALWEIQQLGQKLGAQGDSFLGVAGLGDLIATAMSEDSHNYTCGKWLGEGYHLPEIEKIMGTLPEGINTLRVMLFMAQDYQLELPLASLLRQVIDHELAMSDFYQQFNACLLHEKGMV